MAFQIKTENTNNSSTSNNNATPALYNPKAANWWSLLVLPLGAILHYLNWKALGKNEENKTVKVWIIALCVIEILGWIISPLSFESMGEITDYKSFRHFLNYLSIIGLWVIFMWLVPWRLWCVGFDPLLNNKKKQLERTAKGEPPIKKVPLSGKDQVDYISKEYGKEYKKKSLLIPVAISFIIFFGQGFISGSDSTEVVIVKKALFSPDCPYSIEYIANTVIIDPKWNFEESENKVWVTGSISPAFKKVFKNPNFQPEELALNFLVDLEEMNWSLEEIELDGEVYAANSPYIRSAIAGMCNVTGNRKKGYN